MQLDWTTFLLQIVNFLVLVWLLKRFLYQPVLAVIARRREGIEQALNDAREAEAKAEKLREDYESKLTEQNSAQASALARLADEVAAERVRRLARLDDELSAERERQAALADKQAADAGRKAEEAARAAALGFVTRLLGRLAGSALDSRLVDMLIEDLAKLPTDQLDALREAAAVAETGVQLTTARALADADLDRLLQALNSALGRTLPLTQTIDPDMQSGVRIGVGPWMLAASLADELAFFRSGARRAC
ncbi:F0F1 ATP synthase subunit delta [Azoarcus sp. L1K30]|uniref:F0F1 ATP synthase subunit delta n=1 Tax=Azoarcus sp. L1K30 TaxID=2820277 RepID=UPI001B823D5C|nr:F0F1 ATP synthase subunit delta [Azoarcus sp. L1K30]MBR0565900.1 F0F1 ATP synthase subunit delta [Azoarcus sp. L1K30]